MKVSRFADRVVGLLGAAAFCAALTWSSAGSAAESARDETVRLQGHVLPALASAARDGVSKSGVSGPDATMSLTIVLRRDDEAGFQAYLHDVYDPQSPSFRHFLTQADLSARFGPSAADYEDVSNFLQSEGWDIAERSANRMTLTALGTRLQTERAFGVRIDDYRIGNSTFFANDADPLALPAEGQQFLGSVNTTTDGNGDATFNGTFSVTVNTSRTITATATDPVGNTSEFSAATTICDNDGPIISTPGPIDATAQKKKVNKKKGAFVFFGVSAFDPEDGMVTATANPPSGSFFPLGTTNVQVTATDSCGNTSSTSFAVTVAKKKKKHH